ncbi:MAG TPA: hypothetical protein VLA61_25840 [Ideonella sp.]|uniref:hypothetical protein n=1 Tax=Ideonella sp. TaxID=1929293 RepID=UPI002BB179E1|nr:hypothetical protein [Ideonella sp.]HSI51706.1 hypothetical protein [Ideonella sp.]
MNRTDIESFFKTLLLGDFEENQNTAAQLVGGLISMVPVLDQVMDARDITGSVFNISTKGGFQNATADQLVNLGFAGFGAIPEVGSAFKTVFKPLWKERRAAKGALHSGLDAVEQLLGMTKGGAIGWIRKELLGKWAPRTQQAIDAVNAGLAACVDLTEFLSTAGGWKSWLIPSSIQALAKELLPQIKALQGKVNAALQRASNEIREFLEDLLGEQAAAVVMAVGSKAVAASAVPGTRTRAGHNAAEVHPHGSVPARQSQRKVQEKDEAVALKSGGPVSTAVQVTRKALKDLAAQEKGLIGEHVVDYYELKRLGGSWPHDERKAAWSPATVSKLNVDKRPVNLSLEDLPKVNHPGIDAVWEHAGQYTVTEAKASESIGAVYGLGKYKEKKGLIPVVSGLNPDQQLLHYLLSDSSDKRGTQTPLMQMGLAWVEDRAKRENIPRVARDAIELKRCHRRTVLVTLESSGSLDHVTALADVHLAKTGSEIHPHMEHGATREWEAVAIDAVDAARLNAHEQKKQPKPEETVAKPTRTKKKAP